MKKVAVFGAGAWGTAIAIVLAENGYQVTLWCYETTVASSINTVHENITFLPDITLNSLIVATNNIQETLVDTEYVFFVVPIKFTRGVLEQCKSFYQKDQKWIFLNKGIEKETGFVPTQIIEDVFHTNVQSAVVSGPSFARDLVQKELTAVNCACDDNDLFYQIKGLLENDFLKLVYSADVVGVQFCGALKNIFAYGMGMLEGAGCAENTKAYFFTVLFQEMKQVVVEYGGKKETLFDLAGIGDIILTACGKQSRNFEVGKQVGKGTSLEAVLCDMTAIPESINTLSALIPLLKKKNLDVPFLYTLFSHDVVRIVNKLKTSF